MAWIACGGTTGREGLPQPAQSSGDDGGDNSTFGDGDASSLDATLDGPDAGSNVADATSAIQYADAARLPKIPEGGIDAGSDAGGAVTPWSTWPTCAPDTPIPDPTNPLGVIGESPDDAGGCLAFDWTSLGDAGPPGKGSFDCGDCLRASACGAGAASTGVYPPCSDLREAGTAAQGPAAGQPLFALCAALFECVLRSSCIGGGSTDPNAGVFNCYCGTAAGAACLVAGAANGACKAAIDSAEQVSPTMAVPDVLNHLTDLTKSTVRAGAEVLGLFGCGLVGPCDACFFDGGTP